MNDHIDFNKLELCTTLPKVWCFHVASMNISFPHHRKKNIIKIRVICSSLCTIKTFQLLSFLISGSTSFAHVVNILELRIFSTM